MYVDSYSVRILLWKKVGFIALQNSKRIQKQKLRIEEAAEKYYKNAVTTVIRYIVGISISRNSIQTKNSYFVAFSRIIHAR